LLRDSDGKGKRKSKRKKREKGGKKKIRKRKGMILSFTLIASVSLSLFRMKNRKERT
jgi:hypothetical protein